MSLLLLFRQPPDEPPEDERPVSLGGRVKRMPPLPKPRRRAGSDLGQLMAMSDAQDLQMQRERDARDVLEVTTILLLLEGIY